MGLSFPVEAGGLGARRHAPALTGAIQRGLLSRRLRDRGRVTRCRGTPGCQVDTPVQVAARSSRPSPFINRNCCSEMDGEGSCSNSSHSTAWYFTDQPARSCAGRLRILSASCRAPRPLGRGRVPAHPTVQSRDPPLQLIKLGPQLKQLHGVRIAGGGRVGECSRSNQDGCSNECLSSVQLAA